VDEGGPLPEDPDWLAAELGVRRDLDDMSAWTAAEEEANIGSEHTHETERLSPGFELKSRHASTW
jgi:hypothetical protein